MRLADVIDVFIAGDWGNESPSEETPNAVYCVRGADIVPISIGEFGDIPLRYVSDKSFEEKTLRAGDMIVEKSGGSPTQSTGRVSYVSEALITEKRAVVCTNFCVAFRVKTGWNPYFVYQYWNHIYNNNIFFNFEGKTSGLKNLQLDNALKAIEIPDYTLEQQNRIAETLLKIEQKVLLNRAINDNLEQQAQALFKSWFVDNSNPNWEETSLSEVASFVGGYSYTGEELTDCSNIAMATIKNFGRNGGFKADGFKEINPSAKLKECHYANLFDILVAHTDLTQNADVIGNAELLLTYGKYNSIIFSMDLVKVLPKETFPYRFLLAAMLKNKLFKGHSLGYVNGTTVLHLSKKALPDFEIRKPSDSESKMMDEVLASYYKRMAELLQENDRLISLRDTLIPKLMSGKLKINDLNC